MIDYQVFMYDLPAKVYAFSVLNGDLSYTIFINDDLSPDAKKKALKHELKHIERGDFYSHNVQFVEALAHRTEL